MKTILHHGAIYVTQYTFAQAILIENDTVIKVGTNEEILALADKDTTFIDVQGNAVLPGFHDSHAHLHSVGSALQCISLKGATSIAQMIQRSQDFLAEHPPTEGSFIFGRGWNQDYFCDEKRLPTRHDLDQISTQHPILFMRICGHMAVCNTKALAVCGITKDTPQVPGAEFYFGEDGEPNGIFTENAIDLIRNNIPAPSQQEMEHTIRIAMQHALSNGITSVHSNDIAGDNYKKILGAYDAIFKQDTPKMRIYHQCRFETPVQYQSFFDDGYKTGVGTPYSRIGPLKLFVDGSLGARTAYLRAPYADAPNTQGIACMTQAELNAMVQLADENDSQVAVHAIGDKAIEMVLDAYETVIKQGENPRRHGIIHCQITDDALLNRFAQNHVLAYVQPIFLHYDMHIVADRVGKALARTSYAFGTMYRKGIAVSYGTDSPVEALSPLDNLYCAVARKDLTAFPEDGFVPEEAVTLGEAIALYTKGSAYACFAEQNLGTLQAGFLADLVVLDRNIFANSIEQLRDAKVTLTMVGGTVQYRAEQ